MLVPFVTDSDNDTATTRPRPSITLPDTSNPIAESATAASSSASTKAQVHAAPAPTGTQTVSDPVAEPQEPELDENILALLGDAPKIDTNLGNATHKDLALRWQEILGKGLPKEGKEKLLQEYLIPKNCDLLVAPELNPEVKSALADVMIRRDFSLMTKQKQLGMAIAAINQAIELLISKENHHKILKPVSDACRLLCDIHYEQTNTRRGFVISSINADMKETLSEAKRDKYLFGENLSEKLKTAKSIKKSGTDLKQTVNRNDKSSVWNKNNFLKTSKTTGRLNWKTLPRKTTAKPETGKPRPNQGRAAAGSSSQQRGTSSADQSAARTYRKR
ncbi:hypothetical protein O0L34_g11496 [Tuta absoluta]|nr:hypothetical protein O0L34_g11496 [Tuta absoluta]